MLGIPTVQDRFIQQLLLQALTPIFDPPKFFDHVNHDILMGRIARVIRDKRVLHLIGEYLRRGAVVEGLVQASVEGTPQGGPLSPLLANIYPAKSGTGRVWERKFLGFRLDCQKRIGIAPESLERFTAKVRAKWDGRRSGTSTQLRDDWNRYVRGWWGYYRLAEARRPLRQLEGWIRRHIRKCFWLRWHDRRGRERNLRRLGVTGASLGVATSSRGAWGVAGQPELQWGLRNSVLRRHGFLLPSDLAAG
jgi:hypothetical protein